MNHFEMRWRLEDGVELYAQGWQPDAEPKAVVCLVHGLNEHSSRYAHVAAALNQAGYALLAFDHHGHGRSGGLRGHIPSSSIYLESLDCLLQEAAQRYEGKPRFLYGHSLGGILVLYYTLSRKPVLAGVIAASAGLRTALEEQKFKITLTKWLSPILPKLSIPTGLDPNQLSRDPQAFRRPSAAAQAARQLQAQGVTVRPGMRLFFWFTRQGVSIAPPPPEEMDWDRYARLVLRAAGELLDILQPAQKNRQFYLPLLR